MRYPPILIALLTTTTACTMGDATREPQQITSGDDAPEHDCGSGDAGTGSGAHTPGTCDVEVDVIAVYQPTTCDDEHVAIDKAGDHVLVLSSYEHAKWTVDVAAGAHVDRVFAIGYHEQEVVVNQDGAPADVQLSFLPDGEFQCGYSWPYDGEGCDTNGLLEYAERVTGQDVQSFHGCYQANDWTLYDDMSVVSDCDTASGYEVEGFANACVSDPPPPPDGWGNWTAFDFPTAVKTECTGARFVRWDDRYAEFVGAILCGDADHYKLLMSDHVDGPYLELADYAGYGQDLCELVNPAFTIPDEDDITSGCPDCSISPDFYDPQGDLLFERGYFGELFRTEVGSYWTELAPYYIGCGVPISAKY